MVREQSSGWEQESSSRAFRWAGGDGEVKMYLQNGHQVRKAIDFRAPFSRFGSIVQRFEIFVGRKSQNVGRSIRARCIKNKPQCKGRVAMQTRAVAAIGGSCIPPGNKIKE